MSQAGPSQRRRTPQDGRRGRRGPRRNGGRPRHSFTPEQVEQRRARVPEVRYPDELPVSQRRQDIADAIRDHQVVVIAGETGSGKTTQIPRSASSSAGECTA